MAKASDKRKTSAQLIEELQEPAEMPCESVERLKVLLESVPSGIVVIDAETHEIVAANPATIEMLGAPLEQVIGSVCHNYICPAEKGRCPITDLGQMVDKAERVLLTPDGERVPILKTVASVMLNGREHLIESFVDITEHKQTERALRKSEEKYRVILDSIEEAYYEVDLAGNFTFFNDALCAMLGYTRDELMGANYRQYTGDENTERVYQTFNTVYRTKEPAALFDWEIIRKDGTNKLVEASVSLMTDPVGDEPLGFRGIVRDVTERARSEVIRARTEAEIVKLNSELTTLNRIGQALISALNMEETLTIITERVSHLMGVAAASVVLHDEAQGDLYFAAASGEGADFVLSARFGLGQGIAGWVVQHGEAAIVPDVSQDERFFDDLDKRSGLTTRSILCVPLQAKGQVIGAIEVMNKKAGDFDQEDLRFLTSLAAPAATAIENARLFEQSQAFAQDLAVLNELSQALTARLSVEEVLEEAYRQIARLVDTTNFYIGLYDQEKDEVAISFMVSKSEIDRQITVIPAAHGFTGYIIRNRTSVLVKENVAEWLEEKGIEMVGDPACSWLGVPLLVGDQVLGVMAVQSYTTPCLYGEHDLDLLMAIAGPMAIAIQNARLYEQAQHEIGERKQAEAEVRRRAEQAALTYEVGQRVSGELGLGELLAEIVTVVRDAFDYYGVMLLLEEETGRLTPDQGEAKRLTLQSIAGGYADVFPSDLEIAVGEGMIGHAAASGKSQISNDVSQNPYYARKAEEETKSELAVPIRSGRKLIGVLDLQSDELDAFDETDVMLMETLADQIGAAIGNARLYEEAQRRLREQTMLFDVSQRLADTPLQVDEIAKVAARQFTEVMEAAECSLSLLDPQGDALQTLADFVTKDGIILQNDEQEEESFALSDYPATARVMETRQPLVVQASDPGADPDELAYMRQHEIATLAIVPLVAKGQAVGVIEIVMWEEHHYTAEWLNLAMTLANQIAGALENARLYEEIQRELTERKRMEEVLQETHEELEKYTTILERQTARLRVGAEVAREVSAILDVHQLLDETVRLISDEFGFYHAGVFMVGDLGEYAILRASSSEGGRRMLERGYRVPVDARPEPPDASGIVGYVAATGEYRIALDVGENVATLPSDRRGAVSFNNPDLPDTRSEICLPLRMHGRTIGVLDIQSAQEAAFSESDMAGFQTLADQLAVSIENARLVERTEDQLSEMGRLYGEYSAAAWADLLSPERPRGYIYDRVDVLPVMDSPSPTLDLAPARGESETTGSMLTMPLKLRGQTIGVLGVQESDGVREWSPEEVAIVEAVSDQVAIALDSARLFGEARTHAAEMVVLNELAQSLTARLTVEEVLEETYRGVSRLMDTTNFYIGLYNPELDSVSFPLAFEHGQAANWRPRRLSSGLTEHIIRSRQPLLVREGVSERMEELGIEMIGAPALSWLGAPLLVGDRVLGVMAIQSTTTPRAYGKHEQDLLTAVASQTAIALQSANLFHETQRRATQLAAAAEVARDATAILEVDQLLDETVHLISEQFGYYHAGVFLLDEQDEYAVLQAASSEGGRRMLERGHRLKVGKVGIVGYAAATGEPRVALDVGQDEVHFAHDDLPDTHSEMGLPLKVREQVIGVLDVQSEQVAAFSEDDVSALQTMADQLATAIANARLFQETRSEAQRRALINEMLQAASTSLNPEELLHQAGEVISQRLESPSAIFTWDAAEEILCTVAVHDSKAADVPLPEAFREMTRVINPALFEAVGKRRTSILEVTSSDQEEATRFAGVSGPLVATAKRNQAQSVIYVPLVSRDQVLGVLGIGRLEDQPLVNVEFIELLAANLSVAVENARLYQGAVQTAERLTEVDRLKSQFLANMSHELRTPLNSIIGFSRVILKEIDGPLTDMQRTDLQAVYNSGQHLLGLINDILEVAKIDSGKMELVSEVVNLQDIIKGVMSTAIALVKDKSGVKLQQVVPQDLPTIMGDTRRIRQAILNLVSNAAKFTTEGFIRVEVEVADNEVVISVADSGIGIPPDKIDMIFEPFTQADSSTTREAGGTGLGLSITSSFVKMHGGRMWVESEAGEGSTFYMTLPIHGASLSEEEAGKEQLEPEPELEQKTVLCVEDDDGVVTLFRRYLNNQGYNVVGLTDSTVAVERARELQPFAITLDVMMPGKDGWQVIQELKADPETCDIPVIMCTIVGEKEYGISLGAVDYLLKPILEHDLLAALGRLDWAGGQHLVLVVDDQPEDRNLLRRMLEGQEGYEVVEAGGGQEAIAAIQQTPPHVIILDLMMPNVDGFAVLEAVKTDENTRSIPIIVVTAKDLTTEEREALSSGVEALLQKGIFEQHELLADVAEALNRLGDNAGGESRYEADPT
ncbi:MAG: hypothetical protein B6I35_03220 [Anaerolineaceae bacterium 4572_32.2]|nr:MAG: hypothetical protein B6I35_03220 [Anaerolineaceae bacterium 4572_32.2]HEY71718.1 GAF domain-containing protein [Thermoflexia bacterium]